MRLLEERVGPASIVRLVECDCFTCGLGRELGGEGRAWLLASVPERASLWVTVAHEIAETLRESGSIEAVLDDSEDDEKMPANVVIETGLALVGLPFEKLDSGEAARQLTVWCKLPDWMSRVPRAQLWACRAAVFGDDVTRVPNALRSLEYLPDAPVSREALSLLSNRTAVDGPPDMG